MGQCERSGRRASIPCGAILIASTLWLLPPRAWNPVGAAEGTIGRLRISGATQSIEGSTFLAHAERGDEATIYYFVTAARLLDASRFAERRISALTLLIDLGDGTTIDARGDQVLLAGGLNPGDVAVIRTASRDLAAIAVPLRFDPPRVGQTFAIHDFRGLRLTEQVRFRSTRLLLGDRTSSDVRGLVGAPALIDGHAFGIVTECSASRVPVVALLGASWTFLSRVIPSLNRRLTTHEQARSQSCQPA